MGWTDKFWKATNWAFDTTVHAVADTMNTCGTLACTLGGAAYACSNVLHMQDVSASYYGGIHAAGNFSLGINIVNMNFGINESLPWSYINEVNNNTPAYNLTEYVSTVLVNNASLVCIGSGMLLKTLGSSINLWQEGREERRYALVKGMQLASPALKEYVYVGATALTSSVTLAMFSNAIVAAVLHCSGKIFPNVTYPPNGEQKIYGKNYSGAVITEPFDIDLDLGESNFSVPLYFENLNVTLRKRIVGAANATYGGGFFFKPNGTPETPSLAITEAVSSTVGVIAYLGKNFFADKVKKLHDNRKEEAQINAYSLVKHR